MTMEANFNLTLMAYVTYLGSIVSYPVPRTPPANAILEQGHQIIITMLCTVELEMTNTVETSNIDVFLTDAVLAICSVNYTVLKAFIMLKYLVRICCSLYISLLMGLKLKNIGSIKLTSTCSGKIWHVMIWIPKLVVGDQALLWNDTILCKSKCQNEDDPQSITSVQTKQYNQGSTQKKIWWFTIGRVTPLFSYKCCLWFSYTNKYT